MGIRGLLSWLYWIGFTKMKEAGVYSMVYILKPFWEKVFQSSIINETITEMSAIGL